MTKTRNSVDNNFSYVDYDLIFFIFPLLLDAKKKQLIQYVQNMHFCLYYLLCWINSWESDWMYCLNDFCFWVLSILHQMWRASLGHSPLKNPTIPRMPSIHEVINIQPQLGQGLYASHITLQIPGKHKIKQRWSWSIFLHHTKSIEIILNHWIIWFILSVSF